MAIPGGKGVVQRIRMLLDRGSVEQAKAEARAGGKAVGAGFSSTAGSASASAGKTAGKMLIRELNREFTANMADLRRKLAMGLISEGEFRRKGIQAARQYNQGLISGMNRLRSANAITERQFVSLSGKLKETGNVGVSAFARIREGVRRLATSGLAQTLTFGAVIFSMKQLSQAAAKLMADLTGLASVAEAFGAGQKEAQLAAQELARDGLMTVGDAATSLKNLLASGFSLDEAVQLMNAFKDSAAFGRQAALSFGESIRGATEGIKNGNSILVDNAGITKNLSIILTEAGFAQTDLMKATTDASVRQALFNGILKEAAPFLGDAARYTETAAGQFTRMEAETLKAQQALGLKLLPVTGKFASFAADHLVPAVKSVISWFERFASDNRMIWDVLTGTGDRFMFLVAVFRRGMAQMALDALDVAEKVPFLKMFLGVTGAADRIRAENTAIVRAMTQNIEDIRGRIKTMDQIMEEYRTRNERIAAERDAEFAPTVDIGGKARVQRGAMPEDPDEVAKKADKAAQDLVTSLAKALDMNIASNAERSKAVELLDMYNARAENTNLKLEDRVTAQERANTLQEALNLAEERSADAAEKRRNALIEGLQLQTLTRQEAEELAAIERGLIATMLGDGTLDERAAAAKILETIKRVREGLMGEAPASQGQQIHDYIMGTLEGFSPDSWFDELFYGIGRAAEDAADGVVYAFGSAFDQLFIEGRNFGAFFTTLAKGIAGAMTGAVANYARQKVGENVAYAIEEFAAGLAASANPFTMSLAPMHFAAAAKRGAAATAWAALSGAASSVTSAIGGGGGSGGGYSGSSGALAYGRGIAGSATAGQWEIHLYPSGFNPKDPTHVRILSEGLEEVSATDSRFNIIQHN